MAAAARPCEARARGHEEERKDAEHVPLLDAERETGREQRCLHGDPCDRSDRCRQEGALGLAWRAAENRKAYEHGQRGDREHPGREREVGEMPEEPAGHVGERVVGLGDDLIAAQPGCERAALGDLDRRVRDRSSTSAAAVGQKRTNVPPRRAEPAVPAAASRASSTRSKTADGRTARSTIPWTRTKQASPIAPNASACRPVSGARAPTRS